MIAQRAGCRHRDRVPAYLSNLYRVRIVRRSIHLTPFGGHFCESCLPLETAEIESLGARVVAGAAAGP
jgi:hypothetical protein